MSRRSSSRNQASPDAATHTASSAGRRKGNRPRPGEHGSTAPVATSNSTAAIPHAHTLPMGSRYGGAADIGLVSSWAAVTESSRAVRPALLDVHDHGGLPHLDGVGLGDVRARLIARIDADLVGPHPGAGGIEPRAPGGAVELPAVPRAPQDPALARVAVLAGRDRGDQPGQRPPAEPAARVRAGLAQRVVPPAGVEPPVRAGVDLDGLALAGADLVGRAHDVAGHGDP